MQPTAGFRANQFRVLYGIEDIEAYETESLRKSTSERVNAGGAL